MAPKKPKTENTPEQAEKKEEFLETGVAQKGKKSGVHKPPVYLYAMLFLLAILILAAAAITFLKPVQNGGDTNSGTDSNSQFNDAAYRIVPVTIIYSIECKSCRDTTTIEEQFKFRQILYSIKKVDANSEEGKRIIDRLGIDRVPTAIVDAEKMKLYPTTKKTFDAAVQLRTFDKIGGAYVIPEQNWVPQYYYPIYFLEKVAGFCDSAKPTIVQFDDYSSKENTYGRKLLSSFLTDFNTLVDWKYSFTRTASSADDNAILGNIFLTCAGKEGKYVQLERSMTGIYCNNPFKGDPTIVTDPEIAGCWTISSHYGTPLSQIELDIATSRAGMDSNSVRKCFENRYSLYNQAVNAAKDLQVARAGTFLIDCHETAALEHLRESFCEIHPQLGACAGADLNASE